MIATDGELVWSRSLGGPSWDSGFGVALDSSGNVVVVGKFAGTVDFGGVPLASASGSSDVFVAKYVGPTGAHLFSRRYGGAENENALSVAVDSMDNIILAGSFSGTADFGGPVSLTAVGSSNIFVAKYTLAGAHLWAKPFHAMTATSPGRQAPQSVTVDDAGDIVFAGQFCGTISFGGAEISSADQCSSTAEDTFAARLAGTGGGHVSSVRVGSRTEMARMTLAADAGLYLVGYFDRFAQLGGHGLTSVNGADAFILSLAPL
jgi:hypothetical protein